MIEYAIIDGNDNRIFAISRGEQNQGLLTVERRLDREEAGVYQGDWLPDPLGEGAREQAARDELGQSRQAVQTDPQQAQ